jgi:aryl-alcohol dehydrogenase-like predicted oxidoreductase
MGGKAMIRPLLRRVPGLKPRLAQAIRPLSRAATYSPAELERSLMGSLRTLRCEKIDLLLLHEADEGDISDDLHRGLDDYVQAGVIGAWGVGSSREKVDRIVASNEIPYRFLQFEWSVLSARAPVYADSFCITHGVISSYLARIRKMLVTPEQNRCWSEQIGVDVADTRVLAQLLVAAAVQANSSGIVLFSSKKAAHIRDVASVLNGRIDETLRRFVAAVDNAKVSQERPCVGCSLSLTGSSLARN